MQGRRKKIAVWKQERVSRGVRARLGRASHAWAGMRTSEPHEGKTRASKSREGRRKKIVEWRAGERKLMRGGRRKKYCMEGRRKENY